MSQPVSMTAPDSWIHLYAADTYSLPHRDGQVPALANVALLVVETTRRQIEHPSGTPSPPRLSWPKTLQFAIGVDGGNQGDTSLSVNGISGAPPKDM